MQHGLEEPGSSLRSLAALGSVLGSVPAPRVYMLDTHCPRRHLAPAIAAGTEHGNDVGSTGYQTAKALRWAPSTQHSIAVPLRQHEIAPMQAAVFPGATHAMSVPATRPYHPSMLAGASRGARDRERTDSATDPPLPPKLRNVLYTVVQLPTVTLS